MRFRKALMLILCIITVLNIALITAYADDTEHKTVRVGWYESAFHRTDEFGRKSGYGYEYQQRIATYTGWNYEYVEGSWPELYDKLVAGEIDLLSDVSYTEDREGKILYSSEKMGSEDYHVFISPENTEIRPDDYSTFNGKKVYINKGSVQMRLFKKWAESHDVHPIIIPTTKQVTQLLSELKSGRVDMLVTLDTYGNYEDIIPICKVGSSDTYFGINKKRKDLKREIDAAMNRILDDNRDFNLQLTQKFNKAGAVNSFIGSKDKKWLDEHGAIRVGYMDNYMPFSDKNDKTGKLQGALADYLKYAGTAEKNARLEFETKAYKTSEEAIKALKNDKIDCFFPVALSAYDAEQLGVNITDPFVSTEMYVAVRSNERQGVSNSRKLRVAVISGTLGYETFLKDNFPKWREVLLTDRDDGFKSVASNEADCVLISNYRLNSVSDLCAKYDLSLLSTGEAMNLSFAVRKEDDTLYSVLNKVNRMYPETTKNASLTEHAFEDKKVTLTEYIRDNLAYFIAVVLVIAVIILLLVINNMRAGAKLRKGQQIISEAERDPLTDLYNRYFFVTYTNHFYKENPDKPMDAVVVNIDRFHAINAVNGRDFGDIVLKAVGDSLKAYAHENGGMAGRTGSDSFDLYCPHLDDYNALYNHLQEDINKVSGRVDVRFRMGVMPWQKGEAPEKMFARAWSACSEAKNGYNKHLIVFDEELLKKEELWQRLQNDLAGAIENNELEVYFQPKYKIRGEKPRLTSAEALVRWNHPELGLLNPGEFIPLFERSGQICALDRYVWEHAAEKIAEWKKRFGRTLPVSVNLSRLDIFDPDLVSTLDYIVLKNGLERKNLLLEVTESAYTENAEGLIELINNLRDKGYEIEMDDFGSGYSSLNMLSALPVDVIKMDMLFIQNIEKNERDFHLVELILDIAKYLDVPVVAEGVETEHQLDLLKEAGYDIVQGYYFSKPLPADEFEKKIIGAEK